MKTPPARRSLPISVLFVWFLSLNSMLAAPWAARAEAPEDSALRSDGEIGDGDGGAPLVVRRDREAPYPALALSADLLGVAFGRYAIGAAFSASEHHAVRVAGAWESVWGTAAMSLQAGYQLTPFGGGLAGAFLGASGVLSFAGEGEPFAWAVRGDAGYAWFLGGAWIELRGAVERRVRFAGEVKHGVLAALSLGYAWM